MGRTSLVVQLLRLCVPNAGDEGMGSISDGENPICSVAKPSPPPPEKKFNMGRETQAEERAPIVDTGAYDL